MKIVNGTSHVIFLYNPTDCEEIQGGRKLILKSGCAPVLVIPSGTNLNAVKGNGELPTHLVSSGLPLKGGVVFTSCDAIPEGDIVIVSNLYRSAAKELGLDTSSLATVDGTVYISAEELRPCGCTSLAVG